jgi:hypothetical protein
VRQYKQVVFRRPDPMKWLFRKSTLHIATSIYLFGYGRQNDSEGSEGGTRTPTGFPTTPSPPLSLTDAECYLYGIW